MYVHGPINLMTEKVYLHTNRKCMVRLSDLDAVDCNHWITIQNALWCKPILDYTYIALSLGIMYNGLM